MNLVTFVRKSAIAALSLLCLSALQTHSADAAVEAAFMSSGSDFADSADYAQTDLANEGIALYDEGVALEREGTPASLRAAVEKYTEAAAIFKAENLLPQEAITLHRLGHAYSELDAHKEALDTFKTALTMWQQIGDEESVLELQEDVTFSSLDLGISLEESGSEVEVGIAIIQYERAIDLVPGDANRANRAWLWRQRGHAYQKLGNTQEAIDSFDESLELWRSVGDAENEKVLLEIKVATIYNWGISMQRERTPESLQKALALYNEALPMLSGGEIPDLEAQILHMIGHVQEELGNSAAARDAYLQSLEMWRALNNSEQVSAIEEDLERF